jgi:hypothetical protein
LLNCEQQLRSMVTVARQQSKHVVHNKKECEARCLQPPLSVRLRQTRPMSDAAALTTEASIWNKLWCQVAIWKKWAAKESASFLAAPGPAASVFIARSRSGSDAQILQRSLASKFGHQPGSTTGTCGNARMTFKQQPQRPPPRIHRMLRKSKNMENKTRQDGRNTTLQDKDPRLGCRRDPPLGCIECFVRARLWKTSNASEEQAMEDKTRQDGQNTTHYNSCNHRDPASDTSNAS